jgi:hypothetical protein
MFLCKPAFSVFDTNKNIDWKECDVKLFLKDMVVGQCNGMVWLGAGPS